MLKGTCPVCGRVYWGWALQEPDQQRCECGNRLMIPDLHTPVLYVGIVHDSTWSVYRDKLPLTPDRSQGVRNHSPTGFSWGYAGSGPAQLALALLLDVTDDEFIALTYYQDFKWQVVAKWDTQQNWYMTSRQVLDWLSTQAAQRARR